MYYVSENVAKEEFGKRGKQVMKSEKNVQDKIEKNDSPTLITAAFRALLGSTTDMVFVKDVNLVYVAASMPFVKMVGKNSVDEIVGHTDLEIFEDAELARRYVADDRKLIAEDRNLIDYIEPITEDHGQARYGSTSKYLLKDENGELIGLLGVTKDITRDYVARKHYQQELKYLFELPTDTYAVSYIDVDDWRIISQRRQLIDNNTLQSCFSVERLCEAALESIVDSECEAAEFYRNFTPLALRSIYASGRTDLAFKYERKLSENSIRWVHNTVRLLTDADSGHLCAMLSAKDIDAEKQEQKKLLEAAQMDKMTMLYNRATTMENIRRILMEDADKHHVLFMIDVDNFKDLNDTMGHQAGDVFLIDFAAEIQKCFRKSDVVGRIGGDEFFALMRNVSGLDQTKRKAQEILLAMQKVCADYSSVHISGSIGISLYPEDGKTLKELYAQADSALYQAKGKGKNQYVFASM